VDQDFAPSHSRRSSLVDINLVRVDQDFAPSLSSRSSLVDVNLVPLNRSQ
jgi:hypothetical protein